MQPKMPINMLVTVQAKHNLERKAAETCTSQAAIVNELLLELYPQDAAPAKSAKR